MKGFLLKSIVVVLIVASSFAFSLSAEATCSKSLVYNSCVNEAGGFGIEGNLSSWCNNKLLAPMCRGNDCYTGSLKNFASKVRNDGYIASANVLSKLAEVCDANTYSSSNDSFERIAEDGYKAYKSGDYGHFEDELKRDGRILYDVIKNKVTIRNFIPD